MATITLPSTPGFERVRARYWRQVAMAISPMNGTQQTQAWPKNLKVVEFQLPPMTQAQADDWTEFLDDLFGPTNTFNIDLSDYYPHETGLTSVEMRLMPDYQAAWDIDTAMHYGISFQAMEVRT